MNYSMNITFSAKIIPHLTIGVRFIFSFELESKLELTFSLIITIIYDKSVFNSFITVGYIGLPEKPEINIMLVIKIVILFYS